MTLKTVPFRAIAAVLSVGLGFFAPAHAQLAPVTAYGVPGVAAGAKVDFLTALK